MPFFAFDLAAPANDAQHAGTIMGGGQQQITVDVPDACLNRIGVGQLLVFPMAGGGQWAVGLVDRIACGRPNSAAVSLVGSVRPNGVPAGPAHGFSRSLSATPAMRAPGFALRGDALKAFMRLLVQSSEGPAALVLGQYVLDDEATAYLDGDKFFQRHAALLGSTGSGKSWTV